MPRAALIVALLVAAPGVAQEPDPVQEPRILSARVIGVEAQRLRVDVGTESGVAIGDQVTFYPNVGDPAEALVQEVGPRHALVETLQPAAIEVGTRAEVRASGTVTAVEGERPPHPGWESPPEGWGEDQPLLASPWAVDLGELTSWRSRIYFGVDRYDDRTRGDRASTSYRAGYELDGWNVLGEDDHLEVDLEYRRREVERSGEPKDVDGRLRIDRLAYGREATRSRPSTWRVGRFLQRGSPAMGVLDGAEVGHAPNRGLGYGASVGWRPQLYGDFETFEDLQVAGYVDWLSADGVGQAGLGLQRSWDDGTPDRELVLVEAAYRPRNGFHAYGNAWLDWYSTGERFGRGSGLEVTQAFVGAGWRGARGSGLLASYSHVSFPFLSEDLGFLPPVIDPLDRRNDRLRLDTWRRLGTRWRAGASGWAWDDEAESGGGGELRLDAHGLADGGMSVGGALFSDSGRYTDLLGLRLHTRWTTGAGSWSLLWRGEDLESALPGGGGSTEGFHQSLRGGWDLELGSGWSLSLWYQLDDGAEQDSGYGGFWLQRRS